MEIWPIDFDKTLKEISEWHDQWKEERFGSDSLNPREKDGQTRGTWRYHNKTSDGRYLYGVAEGESLNDEKADSDKVLELLVRIKNINDRLKGKGLSQHLQWKEREQLKGEREGLYKEFLDEVQADIVKQQQKPQQIPPELSTPEAKLYLDKAIKLGLMDSNYKWLKGLQMLACFAYEMSKRLKLGKGERISWKPFETLFSVERNKLRLNKNDIEKSGQVPKENYLIDKVFE